ncbi:hypothetical protein [Nitrospira sp. KM1]|uniref:hypothetical protein n=1 Tax=Nitrospira sp. KM1 TaxID=1936990 RepID=UPI001567BEE1|nr:hypothetical protein [Nitrospira sp. KM1]
MIEGSAHYTEQQPRHYVLALEPGSYALTRYEIDVAESTFRTKVGIASRSTLIDHGQPVGGTFDSQAGELVCIGHFGWTVTRSRRSDGITLKALACSRTTKTKSSGDIPNLDVETMQVRLFKSALFGRDLQPR